MNLSNELRKLIASLFANFISNEILVNVLTTIIMIGLWVLIAYITIIIVKFVTTRSTRRALKQGREVTKEQETVGKLISNIIKFFFFFWIALMILGELGLDIVPLLAGAGVAAFAIGFGAQELIKDVIAGMFLIGEKTFKIGDYIEVGNNTGTITDVGLRRIKIENWKGEVITINNGDIRTIKNFSINPGVAVVEFRADYDFDFKILESAKFKKMLKTFGENNEFVREMPTQTLLVDINDGLKFVFHIKTEVRKYVSVERAFRATLMQFFQSEKIDVAVPVVLTNKA